MVGDNTQLFDPIKNLQATEICGGQQAFPKHAQHLLLFCSPLRRLLTNRIQTNQIHSLLMLTERDGTRTSRRSFMNATGESCGDSLPLSQPLHQEGQKTWTFPLEDGNVQKAATDQRDETQDQSPDAYHFSNFSYFQMPITSCTYTVFLWLSMLHIIIQESSFAFRLLFYPSNSKYLSRKDFLGNQNHSSSCCCYSSSCMILFIKYFSYKPSYCIFFFPRIPSFPFTRTSLQHQKSPNIVPQQLWPVLATWFLYQALC